jgi:hypothetical protein
MPNNHIDLDELQRRTMAQTRQRNGADNVGCGLPGHELPESEQLTQP